MRFLVKRHESLHSSNALDDFLVQLSQRASLDHHHTYIQELRQSSKSPQYSGAHGWGLNPSSPDDELSKSIEDNLEKCRSVAEFLWKLCCQAIEPWSIATSICSAAGIYPRLLPIFFLEQLRQNPKTGPQDISNDWIKFIIKYALSLAYLQHVECLARAYERTWTYAFSGHELINSDSYDGPEAIDPQERPEALLLEVEQGILIRPVQYRIAREICRVDDQFNAQNNYVMQLNMGEGKSSVIVPIVAAEVGDGSQLVRMVVAKPQSKQMMHTLVKALDVNLSKSQVKVLQNMYTNCMESGGVLLIQPEHILSFKLKGLETIYWERPATSSRDISLGTKLLRTYREFESICRDIVDKSDKNLSVKLELIYTMGGPQPIDMSPHRWVIIQRLMDVVANIAQELTNPRHPEGGRFQTIRFLDHRAGNQTIQRLSVELSTNGLEGFPMSIQPRDVQDSVRRYLKYPVVPDPDILKVENELTGVFREKRFKNVLLLLRGLISGDILRFVSGQQRFRVNYGPTSTREPPTMLAVPYRAKDSPSPRSEFSHTDVVTILACLSYYYRGLTLDELLTCFETLGQSRQAELEYQKWISPNLPAVYLSLKSVNLKDKNICEVDIWPLLRFYKSIIDFYLANIVFPKEMRDFPFKLSSSGWDLAKLKNLPLAGFSDTTDSEYVLSLPVQTLDLPEQRHTNASDGQLSALTADSLLDAVTDHRHRISVILDVGAQTIEHGKHEFARSDDDDDEDMEIVEID
ncbi:hypothetical protein QBC38DRAFT_537951 [Podospora fimiseda]|uniref:ubiquitinyl hydrolase 1 n=1 Tax=Podospora fimiseda TaxID=252190 RepID=A0AAN7GYP4_9PEZI|nr:hypothetical protein QBC38DRAFT_537951 [Podospora fimiseda]